MITYPEHPQVNWSDTTKIGRATAAAVTCPICNETRYVSRAYIVYRIKINGFSSICYKDRLVGKTKKTTLAKLPHPAIDWGDTKLVKKGEQRYTLVAVTCPVCKRKRYLQVGSTAKSIRRGWFSGKCHNCSDKKRKRNWTILGPGRKIEPKGEYIWLFKSAIATEHLWLFDAMRHSRNHVTEHRMVIALHLNRPLKTYEWVDHIDGNKQNNDISNLRIYIRGRNMPGDHPGYGLYYHEWQMALVEIENLKREIEALKK